MLQEGRNCWKKYESGHSVQVFIDAADYFAALSSYIQQARHSIFILGWDIDSRIKLIHRDRAPSLIDLLKAATKKNPELQIYILCWDFPIPYSLEREIFQPVRLSWFTSKNIHFEYDSEHPMGASHHQKIVVIDDSIAFSGGLDITANRWDTFCHKARDPQRKNPAGVLYGPFHDVQAGLQGPAVRDFAALVRERWFRATDQKVLPQLASNTALSPLKSDFEDAAVAIARTYPHYKNYPEIHEVEALYIDLISIAQKYIYIESQYMTSLSVQKALLKRLNENPKLEVVLVLPKKLGGWVEQTAIEDLQDRFLYSLKNNRVHAYFPNDSQLADPFYIIVHSKVLIIDDTYLRVGSSNLNNRSMGFDTECDVLVSAKNDDDKRKVRVQLARLLADHCGCDVSQAEGLLQSSCGPLSVLIERLNSQSGSKTLNAFPIKKSHLNADEAIFFDLPEALKPEELADEVIYSKSVYERARALRWSWSAYAITFAAVALASFFNNTLPQFSPELALVFFAVAGIVPLPLNILIVLIVCIFDAWSALGIVLMGGVLASLLAYLIGRVLGATFPFQLPKLRHMLSHSDRTQNQISLLLLRIFPIAPFSFIGYAAGTARMNFLDYLTISAIGLVPVVATAVLLENRIQNAIEHPGWWSILSLLLLSLTLAYVFRRLIRRFSPPSS